MKRLPHKGRHNWWLLRHGRKMSRRLHRKGLKAGEHLICLRRGCPATMKAGRG